MRSILVSLSVLFTPLSALADEPVVAVTTPTTPGSTAIVEGESVTMPAKRAMIRVDVGINLSTDTAGDPIQIAPDFWYGVDNKLSIGLLHSFVGITGFMGFPVGSGICIGDGCLADYSAAGAIRYQFHQTKKMAFAVDGAVRGQLATVELAPGMEETSLFLSAKLGVVGRYRVTPKVAIDVQPALFFGITERDNNGEVLAIPVTLNLAIDKKLSLLVQTGAFIPFSEAGDSFLIPATIGASFMVNKQAMIYGAFSLFAIAAGGDVSGVDGRSFSIGGGYAL